MMKYTLWIIVILLSTPVYAQNISNMNEQDMQQMMEQAQKMQACMQDIDQSRLPELERRSHDMQAEVKSLCAEGKRDRAEQTAMDFAMEMSQDKDLQAMRKCGEMMQGVMPKIPPIGYERSAKNKHICDQ
jgi:Skp family chaperone for outer membrane proteins